MNISGIGLYSGNYNFIHTDRLSGSKIQASNAEQRVVSGEQEQQTRSQEYELRQQQIRAGQIFNSADYAKQYAPGKTYEMKGADSELASLDESGSGSGSRQSQIMQQYQLFMGETQAQGANQAAMNARAVRGVENFSF